MKQTLGILFDECIFCSLIDDDTRLDDWNRNAIGRLTNDFFYTGLCGFIQNFKSKIWISTKQIQICMSKNTSSIEFRYHTKSFSSCVTLNRTHNG